MFLFLFDQINESESEFESDGSDLVSTNLLQRKKYIFSYQNKQIILYLWCRVII